MAKRPHIVIFNPDHWRGDVLGHLGNPAAMTPNLDRWVETEAVSFRHAFCQNPVCTPSRCSFMTGWYPHVRGHRTMPHLLQPDEPMLLKALKEAGCFVWWGGKHVLVELIDMPATVEALAGLTPQHDHFGRSLLPLIAGETDAHRDAVFCQGAGAE